MAFAATSGELDTAVDALGHVFRKMLKLAEIEKSAQLMAEEIEKTRRRKHDGTDHGPGAATAGHDGPGATDQRHHRCH